MVSQFSARCTVFKSRFSDKSIIATVARHIEDAFDAKLNEHYCVTEAFTADLATGTIKLGDKTTAIHGLRSNTNGLLTLTRCYSPQDRQRVLSIIEQASQTSLRFSFQTTIIRGGDIRIPLLCSGETVVSTDGKSGWIKGVFVFSKGLLH